MDRETNILNLVPPQMFSLWRHKMETFSPLLAICAGNSPVTGEIPIQKPMARSFDVSLICAWINGWVKNREAGNFQTTSRPLWRHCNGNTDRVSDFHYGEWGKFVAFTYNICLCIFYKMFQNIATCNCKHYSIFMCQMAITALILRKTIDLRIP